MQKKKTDLEHFIKDNNKLNILPYILFHCSNLSLIPGFTLAVEYFVFTLGIQFMLTGFTNQFNCPVLVVCLL